MSEAKIVNEPQKSANGKVPIKFSKRWGKYQVGEVAGFDPEISAGHVKNGSAQYVEADRTPTPGAEPTPKK